MNFSNAKRFELVMSGGAGEGAQAHNHGQANHWKLNGASSDGHTGKPLFSGKRRTGVMMNLKNETNFPHNIHTHGHSFRLLDGMDDGWKPYWLDSVLVMPKRAEKIAFVADNPGKWMLHCHMLEHHETGMATWFEVT
jgi:FtsP/CotA-like multicopper oxidase with cupredoxin domain